ncbi:hypothetical protein [Streptomyces kaniharaensis]|uniref:hypothetical protein n=1 Tax=Streptomyces kaniharaensis TaxID=212423 RepID=UPI0018A874E9|nr:hypothetical protein [Streptomyces kaniharaensis]
MLQPLAPDKIDRSVAAATTPAARLVLALAAVHAARVAQIATLMLDDVDIGNRRLTIAGRVRPVDDRTLKLLLAWLEYRRERWPNTADLHLLINNQTATGTGRASNRWIRGPLRGQEATLERLRVDRQLEEAMVQGPDPLHLAEVFGLHEKISTTGEGWQVSRRRQAGAARLVRLSCTDLRGVLEAWVTIQA